MRLQSGRTAGRLGGRKSPWGKRAVISPKDRLRPLSGWPTLRERYSEGSAPPYRLVVRRSIFPCTAMLPVEETLRSERTLSKNLLHGQKVSSVRQKLLVPLF